MATIDLGRIKFKWQGAWSSSTAYVVDDVVESGGNTYVCIAASTNNVPPNATYWELMAQKGTDTSVATTQGDIIYHNGSSLARLGAGTSGQVLQTNGTGANPSWATISSDYVKLASGTMSSQSSTFDINGYFTSAYNHYELVIDNLRNTNSANATFLKFLVGGSPDSTGNYNYGVRYNGTSSANSGNNGDYNSFGDTRFQVSNDLSSNANYKAVQHYRIYNPLETNQYKAITWHNLGFYQNGNGFLTQMGGGMWQKTDAVSGVQIIPQASTLEELKFNLYGIKGD